MELNREDDTSLTLAQHATKCITAFHRYLAAPRAREKLIIMERKRTSFILWASVMKVFEPREASLDHRLRDSPAMVEKIHQLFDVILHAITLNTVDAHTLQSEEPPTTKKRRLSESGRAEIDKKPDGPRNIDIFGGQGEINLTQMVFTIGGTVVHLWRLFYELRPSGDYLTAVALDPSLDKSWWAHLGRSNYKQGIRRKNSSSSI
ncbi:hypothetical protein MY3296_004932 [Beauveria thailandica]